MQITTPQQLILDFNRMPEFQKLNAYYTQSTIYDVLGVQRNETRHSAFLAWLLNPKASHALKEMPLRKFLALIAAKADDEAKCFYDVVRRHLLSGNYLLNVDCVNTEQSIIGLAAERIADMEDIVEKKGNGQFKEDAQNRFDIWLLAHITIADQQDCERNWTIPVVVENKIYSNESHADDGEKAQTVRYQKAMSVLKKMVCNDDYCQPLLVFLTPSDAKKDPASLSFIHLTYQELLDYVIQPCAMLVSAERADVETCALVNGYVRNLSCPSNQDGESKKDYSILAIAETENQDLERLFNSDAFQVALRTVFPKESKMLLGRPSKDYPDDTPLLEQFWNANESLFKIVLHNHFKNDKKKMAIVRKIVRVSNRDNTRYFVATKQGEPWLNSKAASKSEASFLIFKAYCELQHKKTPSALLTIDDLRREFDCGLNSYYHNRFLHYLFYDFAKEVTIDVVTHKWYGNVICPESNNWDFYWDDAHQLPHVEGDVRNVKMWRKDDFDRLVEKARKLGIVVVPKDY